MSVTKRRILLAVGPGLFQGALARMILSADRAAEVVELARSGRAADERAYDAAIVCGSLPAGIRSEVVITLPDDLGSAGVGTLRLASGVREVQIDGPEQVIDLLDAHAPHEHSGR